MVPYPEISVALVYLVIIAALLSGTIISFREKEYRAGLIFVGISALFLFLFSLPVIFDSEIITLIISRFPIILCVVLIVLFLPIKRKNKIAESFPDTKFDERDHPLSRRRLIEGSENYNDYYLRKPEVKKQDEFFKTKPGLLSEQAIRYHSTTFKVADSNFQIIEYLKPHVNGKIASTKINISPAKSTDFLTKWIKKQGAYSVGYCELKEYHKYSYSGKIADYGKKIEINHKYAIAFTMEMEKELVDAAPDGPIVMEASHVYLYSGIVAVNVANYIRSLGYSARAHIDANYEVICPLVAQDAGLGKIGRMGLLMTPRLGPRVRIAVVTTDMPVRPKSKVDFTEMIEFCETCTKCAVNCPTQAIAFDERKSDSGGLRWKIDSNACYLFWCTNGTDCGKCVNVCPYSHPNNALHNFVRWGIRNNFLFAKLAIHLDDLLYGKKPKTRNIPAWINTY